MFESDPEILAGWKMSYDEISNGSYRVTMNRDSGEREVVLDADFDRAVRLCQEQAFETERKISNNWGRFVFDTCRLKMGGRQIVEEIYHSLHFGSWVIELPVKRLVFDGREDLLMLQFKSDEAWT